MIILLASLIRLIGWTTSPLWYDEAISLERASMPLMTHAAYNLNAWEIMLRAFACPELIRVPAMVASILTIYTASKVCDELKFTDEQKTVTLIILATLPGLIWMSQDARYYAGVGLLFIASIYFALTARWLGLAGLLGLSIYIHPTAPAYLLPALAIALISFHWTPRYLVYIALFVLTWVPFVILYNNAPASSPADSWLVRSDALYMLEQFGLSIGVTAIPTLLALPMTALIILLACLNYQRAKFPLMMFVLPLAALIVVSVIVKPVFFYRTVQPLGIALAFMTGAAYGRTSHYHAYVIIGVTLLLGLSNYDPSIHGGHLDRMAQIINVNSQKGECVRYENKFTALPMRLIVTIPECDASTREEWTVTTTKQSGRIISQSDGWHFPKVYLYDNK